MTPSMEEVIAMWSDALSDSYSAQDLIWKLYSGLVTQTSNTDRESIEVGGDVA